MYEPGVSPGCGVLFKLQITCNLASDQEHIL